MEATEAPREGLPWMPEEDLLILAEPDDGGHLPSAAVEAFEAIKHLRETAIRVVSAYASGNGVGEAVAALEGALLVGIDPD